MKIACLQFAPQVGDVNNNLNRADSVLSKANIKDKDIDLLVLPELAFSGYNFRSLQHITPYLEPTASGITSLWARTTALKYNCVVSVGYPEKVDVSPKWPASPEYYNSAITVNADGETLANYRKSFLYYTDETWALEGPDGFWDGKIQGLGNVSMGICMDLNPYKFEAPWVAWEFAHHILFRQSNLVILSMAWLTREDGRAFSRTPKEPDMETLSYWISRLEPLIRNEGEEEIICVFANRTGSEDEAVYSGTSAVLGIQDGEVKVYGILGRGDRELLVIDTSLRPKYQLVTDPKSRSKKSDTRSAAPGSPQPQPRPPQQAMSPPPMSSPSSTGSSVISTKSFKSELSISTGGTSAEIPSTIIPPLDDISFTPTSPVENPFIQSYYGDEPLFDMPIIDPKEVVFDQGRRPTPIPSSEQGRQPTPVPHSTYGLPRRPTPVPPPISEQVKHAIVAPISPRFDRPQSPKSRNCSRSRGPTYDDPHARPSSRQSSRHTPVDLDDSPLLGSLSSGSFPVTTDVRRTLEDVRQSLADVRAMRDSRPSRVDFTTRTQPAQSAQSVPADPESRVTTHDIPPLEDFVCFEDWINFESFETTEDGTIPEAMFLPGKEDVIISGGSTMSEEMVVPGGPIKSEVLAFRPKLPSKFESDEPFESSFTRNCLGPRSRHILPRPRSTIW